MQIPRLRYAPVEMTNLFSWGGYLPSMLAQRDAIFPALMASLFCLVVVRAVTARPKAEQVGLFFPEG
jgi:hypothetical protein